MIIAANSAASNTSSKPLRSAAKSMKPEFSFVREFNQLVRDRHFHEHKNKTGRATPEFMVEPA